MGLVDGEARWTAIFDYEDMHRQSFVCWDFVKLEIELKIRAVQEVYPMGGDEFIKSVYKFKDRINKQTERLNDKHFTE